MLPYPLSHMPDVAFELVHPRFACLSVFEFIVKRTVIEVIPVLRVSEMTAPFSSVPPGELYFGNVSAVNAWLECKPG